jgi:hypothetical protein
MDRDLVDRPRKKTRFDLASNVVYNVEKLEYTDIVGNFRDSSDPNWGIIGFSRHIRLSAFALRYANLLRNMFDAWSVLTKRVV